MSFLQYLLPGRYFQSPGINGNELMTAAIYSIHGPSSVISIQRVPKPIPNYDQVLVKVAATCINPIDIKLRKHPISSLILPKPKIPGTDISGIIVSAPKDSGYNEGDEVIAMMPMLFWSFGASAEYAAIPISLIAPKPKNISFVQAAAIPLVGTTVVTGFNSVLETMNQTSLENCKVLIQAGGGGVGSFAIQYAKNVLNAKVVATTCSTSKIDYVRSLGADIIIDYKVTNFEDVIQDYDVVFDTLAYEYKERTLNPNSRVIRKDGKGHYVHIGGSSPTIEPGDPGSDPFGLSVPEARFDKLMSHYWYQWSSSFSKKVGLSTEEVHYHVVFVRPNGNILREISKHIEENKINCFIDKVFPLNEIQQAHNYIEEGHTVGKVVLTLI